MQCTVQTRGLCDLHILYLLHQLFWSTDNNSLYFTSAFYTINKNTMPPKLSKRSKTSRVS